MQQLMHRLCAGLLACALAGVALPSLAASDPRVVTGISTELDRITLTLRDQEGLVLLIEKQYGGGTPNLYGATSFEQKLGEGQIFFALAESSKDQKNYERAAISLFDIVEAPHYKNRSGYDDALFTLAESLFHLNFRYGAREQYQKLAARNSARYREASIVRLIEIAGLLNNYDGVDEYYKRYEEIAKGDIRPSVRYARGKLLLRRGRYAASEAELSKIPPKDGYHVRGTYLRGVGLLQQGKLEDAVTMFKAAAVAAPAVPEDREVQELAHLARGRVYFEMGMLAESSDAYQEIEHTSQYFPEMLFEVAWTFVKRGQSFKDDNQKADAEYHKALQALDILLISNTNKRLESEVRILRGNLLLRLSRHEEAERAFGDVVNDYSPTLKTLEIQMAAAGNADAILDELLRRDARSVTVDSILPPLVQQWAAGDDSVKDALHIYLEIESTKTQVNETRELAEKLLKFIDAPNRMDLFPALQEARSKGLSVENSLLDSSGVLAEMRGQLIGSLAETPTAADYRTARDNRRSLQRKLATMPKTTEDMQVRRGKFEARMAEVEKVLFRQQLEIDVVQAQIAAIDATVRDRKMNGTLKPEEEAYWRNELVGVQGALEQMRGAERDLKGILKSERETLTVSGGAGNQESAIRSQYREALTREAQLAEFIMPGVDPTVTPMLGTIESKRQKADGLLGRLDAFNETLRKQVDGQASEMRGIVMLERTRVEEYERAVGAYEGEASEMAAVLTQNALKGVRDQFYDVVLRADVGLIDLAWHQKQEKTDAVSTLVRKQKSDLKTLDEEFSDVLRDVE